MTQTILSNQIQVKSKCTIMVPQNGSCVRAFTTFPCRVRAVALMVPKNKNTITIRAYRWNMPGLLKFPIKYFLLVWLVREYYSTAWWTIIRIPFLFSLRHEREWMKIKNPLITLIDPHVLTCVSKKYLIFTLIIPRNIEKSIFLLLFLKTFSLPYLF